MRSLRLILTISVGLLFIWPGFLTPVVAQPEGENLTATPAAAPAMVPLTKELVEQRLAQVEKNTALTDEMRQRVGDLYRQILDRLQRAVDWKKTAEVYADARKTAAEKALKLRESLKNSPVEEKKPLETDLQKLEVALAAVEGDLASARKSLTDSDEQLKQMSARRLALPQVISDLRQAADKARQETDLKPVASETADLIEARKYQALALKQVADAEAAACEQELSSFDVRLDLLQATREAQSRNVTQLEKRQALIKTAVNERRREEADAAARKAQKTVQETELRHPLLVVVAEENARAATRRTGERGFTARIEETTARIEQSRKRLQQMREELLGLKERVKTTGLTPSLGLLLRVRLNELPSLRNMQKQVNERRGTISGVQLASVELEERLSALIDLDLAGTERIRSFEPGLDPETIAGLREPLKDLLRSLSGNLDALLRDANTHLVKLVDLDAVERQLMMETNRYRMFIFENILWIRSAPVLDWSSFRRGVEAIARSFHPRKGISILEAVSSGVAAEPVLSSLLLFIAFFLFGIRKRLKRMIESCKEAGSRVSSAGFKHTLQALALTLISALPWPVIFYMLGFILQNSPLNSELPMALGVGFGNLAIPLLILLFFSGLLRPCGVAETQFRWGPEGALRTVHALIFWLTMIAVPLHLLHTMVMSQGQEALRENGGRLIFIVAMIIAATVLRHFFKPSGIFFQSLKESETGKMLWNHRLTLLAIIVGLPMTVAGLAALGWFYTAEQVTLRVLRTLAILAISLLVYVLGVQLIQLSRRNLAKLRLTAVRELTGEILEPAIHEIGLQAQWVFSAVLSVGVTLGLWSIWQDMIPALRGIYGYALWTTTVKGSVMIAGEGGGPTVVEQVVNITIADVAISMIILTMMVMLSRNMPGFLDFAILRRLPMDHGLRFAIRTVTGYLITIIGLLFAFAQLGISWEKVQWLAAAVSLGLGFGLQEIFANFVSGLILLFERPLRVGDVVTVGEMTGEVSRVQIRATTITDWDNREIVIPNKEFITGRLTNWTLTSSIVRFVFKVGVAYGTDTEKVTRILRKIAENHEDVLKSPEPLVVFNNFGDSSLDFELRVYKEGLGRFAAFRHTVNSEINAAFLREGVSIPFPQRDLHVKTVESLFPVRVEKGSGETIAECGSPA